MVDTTLPGLLLTGDHASRPAATAVGIGTLYACSTHGLAYQSDGATWSTWATFGGDVGAHTGDTTDAHDASAISFAPAGSIAATDVQAAIEEVASEAGGAAWVGCRIYHNAAQTLADATATALLWNTSREDTDNFHFESDANLTGTVAKAAASAVITGTGTAFTTELAVNQVVLVPGTATEVFVVKVITDDTHFTAWANAANTASGQTAARSSKYLAIPAGKTGKGRIQIALEYAADADGYRQEGILISGATWGGFDGRPAIIGGVQETRKSWSTPWFDVTEGDYIHVLATQTSGGNLNITRGANYSPELSFEWRA